jgi:hypothetical protein
LLYFSVANDLNQRKFIYVTNGKDSTTVDNFAEDDDFFKTMIYLGCGKLDLNVAK